MKNGRKRIRKCTFQENYGGGKQIRVQDEDWDGQGKKIKRWTQRLECSEQETLRIRRK
jgi:hypothetical protein